MYLSPLLQKKLDAPVKAFEVAIRSYVADCLLQAYPTKDSLKCELEKRVRTVKSTNVIFSGKLSSAKKLLGEASWNAFWDNLNFMQSCYKKGYHYKSHDVTDLNDTILMPYVFQDLYQSLIQAFAKIEDFISYLSNYHSVRNSLSHQGSYQISKSDSQACVKFMVESGKVLDKKYFWYRSFSDISADIEDFLCSFSGKSLQIDNLDFVPFPTNQIVCRETEINQLFTFVCGWDGQRRLRNKKHLVCVSGYGGIGKTSLVTEFISRLIDLIGSDSYTGLCPEFILFYSSKIELLDFDRTSGNLYSKKVRSQFSTYNELRASLNQDLGIDEFVDGWKHEGILIIDNLETLSYDDRKQVIDFINYDLPPTIQVIITTRIPEHADELIALKGFQSDSGLTFIQTYLTKNDIKLDLREDQLRELVKCSYGNSLVLVLAIKRLSSKIISFNEIINEMRRLPKDNPDNSISHFMFQNTIEDLFKNFPQYKDLIKSILLCLSVRQEPLSADILAFAHSKTTNTIDDIEEVLDLLANYLIVEKHGIYYAINEFANQFILISMQPSPESKRRWESNLLTAIHEIENQKKTVSDFKTQYPELSTVLDEWSGEHDEECLAICHSFELYNYKNRVTTKNSEYEIDQLNRQFDQIEYRYSAHPYTYYQRARILKELRQEKVIGEKYNDLIKSNYERCLMMLDTPSFEQIKSTKTYPSVLWIFAQFLLSIEEIDEASHYAHLSVQNFDNLEISSEERYDAFAIYGVAEAKLFPTEWDTSHLKNAREAYDKLKDTKKKNRLLDQHIELLKSEIAKYYLIKI